jgi:general stress protein CsbA
MKNYLIIIGAALLFALILSHVFSRLTFERWTIILFAAALFFTVRKKFRRR